MTRAFILISLFFACILAVSSAALAVTVTANSTLPRGTQLSESDLTVKTTGSALRSDVLANYVGKELSRTVYNGTPIRRSDVKEPVLVKRNSQVSMVYRVGRLEITASGRAIQEGALGDRITVINSDSRKKVDGVVTGRDRVEMAP